MLIELSKGFKNPKHAASWERGIGGPRAVKRLDGSVFVDAPARKSFADALRATPVDQVTANDVLAVLKPVWSTRHETASRLRGQIAQVLDAAKAVPLCGNADSEWDHQCIQSCEPHGLEFTSHLASYRRG